MANRLGFKRVILPSRDRHMTVIRGHEEVTGGHVRSQTVT